MFLAAYKVVYPLKVGLINRATSLPYTLVESRLRYYKEVL
jgi:hypothetical protein